MEATHAITLRTHSALGLVWTPIGTLETTLWSQPPVLRRRPAGSQASRAAFSSGEFDGQGSGHDYLGTLYMPSTGSCLQLHRFDR